MDIPRITLFLCVFVIVKCGYPPDGTGIKFNKDADRMNAEAKKKVDVLSEELLPYIIAEQERRTTLYRRVMTAIQNGEKGVTIAEIRNKPPLIIRKGLMFRCPANRVPKEPDGSGIIMCEEDIEPTPVMYDSCLSAEDRDLYVADNKYFFCNRHKVEGPDLPRNGSTIIGCAPSVRTSLNYTSMKCALEDTDDVVVHYRYYPDRTYKFVTELDPDREVCDHWNPCQIGYIYSLPSPDQALPANELWQDTKNEFVRIGKPYQTAPRTLRIPDGYKFDSVWKDQAPYSGNAHAAHRIPQSSIMIKEFQGTEMGPDGRRCFSCIAKFISIALGFPRITDNCLGTLFAIFLPEDGSNRKERALEIVTLEKATIEMEVKIVIQLPQAVIDPALIEFKCQKCRVVGIVVRGDDGAMYNLETTRYKVLVMNDGKKAVQIHLDNAKSKDFGTYMVTFQNDDGIEEIIQALQLHFLQVSILRTVATVGGHLDQHINYSCDGECEMTDVTCNGESVTTSGRVSIVPAVKLISFNFPSFEDSNACAYVGVFKHEGGTFRKLLAVIETVTVTAHVTNAPLNGVPYDFEVAITAEGDFEVEKVTVNGLELEKAPTRRSGDVAPRAYFTASPTSIDVHIVEFSEMYEGVYMAVLKFDQDLVTKMIAHIKGPDEAEEAPTTVVPDTTALPASDSTTKAEGEPVEGGGETENPPQPSGEPETGGNTEPTGEPQQ